jgi:hypothetical protein
MRTYSAVIVFAAAMIPSVLAAETPPIAHANKDAVRNDPTLTRAKQIKNNIEETERDLAQQEQAAFQRIEQALQQISEGSLASQQEALEGFRDATGVLRQLSRDLLANRDKIITDIDKLGHINRLAVPVFQNASKTFAEYAKDEPYEELKKDYTRLAAVWKLIADNLEKRSAQYETENKELADTLRYLERTAIFLDRLYQHFDSLPNISPLTERDQYIENLKKFIRSFERLRELFHGFDDELRANAIADDLHPKASVGQTILAAYPKVTGKIQQMEPSAFRTMLPIVGVPFLVGCVYLPIKTYRWIFRRERPQSSKPFRRRG